MARPDDEQAAGSRVWALAAGATLWTPLCTAILRRPVLAVALQGVAAFAGLDCVLPLLGVSNRASLVVAAAAAALGAPFVVGRGARRRALAAVVVGAALAGAAFAGGARGVPPAPPRFVSGAIGPRGGDRELVGPRPELDAPPARPGWPTALAAP